MSSTTASSTSRNASASSSLLNSPLSPSQDIKWEEDSRGLHNRRDRGTEACWNVLTKTFGHAKYKGKQKEIIEAAAEGTDVFVLAPTGMGKSLCFQIPAIAEHHGLTVVVSPLLALMKNQVAKLRCVGIPVVAFTSETSRGGKQHLIEDLHSGHPSTRLLYVSPEKFCTLEFNKLLATVYEQGGLNRLVVDEVWHLLTHTAYRNGDTTFVPNIDALAPFRDRFPNIPIMALTATATPVVQDDIVRSLKMSEENLLKVVHPFNRENLFYEVRYLSSPNPDAHMVDVFEYINSLHIRRGRPSSGIVYCRTRARCDELASYLRGRGLNARPYHRGIKSTILDKTLDEWEQGGTGEGGIDVVCATIAFGMGIDKADVRYILHYDLPKSLEGYYQETGRGGRDGLPAKCILFYSREDVVRVRKWVSGTHAKRLVWAESMEGPMPSQRAVDSLTALINLAESVHTCRHVAICRYFGESIDSSDFQAVKTYCNEMCDVCKSPDKTKRRKLALSSEELVSSQRAALYRQVEGEDEDGYPPACQPRVQLNAGRPCVPAKDYASGGKLGEDHDGHDAATTSVANQEQLNRHRSTNRPSAAPARRATSGPGKRAASDMGVEQKRYGSTKKAKVAPVPLGMSTRLKQTLNKPFRTPFRSPLIQQRQQPLQEQPRNGTDAPTANVQDDGWDAPPSSTPGPDFSELSHVNDEDMIDISDSPSPPIHLPDTNIELDASFSQKISLSLRTGTFTSLRRALHGVFAEGDASNVLWEKLNVTSADTSTRNDVLATVARELEFSVLSLSRTEDGYNARCREQIQAVKLLAEPAAWTAAGNDDFEDSREIAATIKRLYASIRRKTKGKSRA